MSMVTRLASVGRVSLLGAGAALAALGLASTSFASPAPAPAAAPKIPAPAAPSATDDPVARLGACLAGGGGGDILLLVDESGSVAESDPTNGRVTAARAFADQLADYVARNDADVSVAVSTFSGGYTGQLDWTKLDAASTAGVTAAIDALADRNTGAETDYWAALNGAQAQLAAASSARGAAVASCQALVWFSDGELSFTPGSGQEKKPFAPDLAITSDAAAAEAVNLATTDICRDGGLIDQLRARNVITFGIGLDGPSVPAGGFDLMQRIATGTAAGSGCGTRTTPTPGQFFRVSDVDTMLLAFDAMGTPGQPPLVQERGICQNVVCTSEGHTFVLDTSTSSVTVLGTSEADGTEASIMSPTGATAAIPRTGTTATVDGVGISYEWMSERTVSITIDHGTAATWTGAWQFAFVDPKGASAGKKSTSHIRVQGDLVPAWSGASDGSLFSGEPVDLQFSFARRDGTPADPSVIVGSLEYVATLTDSAGAVRELVRATSPDQLAAPVAVPLDGVALGAATLAISSTITTAPTTFEGKPVAGTALAPEVATVALTILPPPNYPSVATAIDFGKTENSTVELQAALPVTGSGCVKLASTTVAPAAGPAGVDQVTLALGDGSCVAPTADGTVPMMLTTTSNANGVLSGTFDVVLTPDGGGPELTSTVAYSAELMRPVAPLNFWLTLVIALLLGVGLPVAALYLVKRVSSTIPARALYGFVTDVTVSGSSLSRGGAPFALATDDFNNLMAVPGGCRSLMVEDVELRVVLGALPFGRGHVVVEAPGRLTASGANPSTDRSGAKAQLPLAVHNNWVLIRTPGDAEGAARLLVLLGANDQQVTQQVVSNANQSAPGVFVRLMEAERASAGSSGGDAPKSDPGDPFGGGSSGGSAGPFGGGGPFGSGSGGGPGDPFASGAGAPAKGAAPAPVPTPAGGVSGGNPFDPFA